MLKMKSLSVLTAVALGVTLSAAEANAQYRGGPRGAPAGRAVPRVYGPRVYTPAFSPLYRPRIIAPRIVGVVPYRPYFYPFRPGLTIGFYSSYGYPYGSGYYGYPYYPYSSYSSYGAYPLPPPAYVTAVPGYSYGGVRIQGAPPDAQVFADGYYVGIVRDFDGALQHMNLTAGAHTIEIRPAGVPPISFQVNVNPGQTITYHAGVPY
jgi:hypothetical protein